jgi:hypothetical protein
MDLDFLSLVNVMQVSSIAAQKPNDKTTKQQQRQMKK